MREQPGLTPELIAEWTLILRAAAGASIGPVFTATQNDGCGHCLWCPETDNISFTEGFPDWMGDVIPGSYAATYGLAAQSVYDMESLGTCFSSYADPLTTEGFLAAVVRDNGGRPIMCRSGHSWIKEKMKESGALLGGEFTGHICFRDRWFGFDDALYCAARLLELLAAESRTLDELLAELRDIVAGLDLNEAEDADRVRNPFPQGL